MASLRRSRHDVDCILDSPVLAARHGEFFCRVVYSYGLLIDLLALFSYFRTLNTTRKHP